MINFINRFSFVGRKREIAQVGSRAFTTSTNKDTAALEAIGAVPLVFVRHGQSTWNQKNIFIGMTDTPLTTDGVLEARLAGSLLNKEGAVFDVVYTSLLRRSTKTVWLVMQELMLEWVPVIKDWRLNERNYGALVGRNKKQCVEEFGTDQVRLWRRSWDTPPPPMDPSHVYWPAKDPRYAALGIKESDIPVCESLKDVTKRTSVFWDECIVPALKQKKRIMIVGHENNLRSIIKRLDGISNEDIIGVELPRAIPLLYFLHPETLKPIRTADSESDLISGRYLVEGDQLKNIAERDQRQVYDLSEKKNLEGDDANETASYMGWVNTQIGPSHGSPLLGPKVTDESISQQGNKNKHPSKSFWQSEEKKKKKNDEAAV